MVPYSFFLFFSLIPEFLEDLPDFSCIPNVHPPQNLHLPVLPETKSKEQYKEPECNGEGSPFDRIRPREKIEPIVHEERAGNHENDRSDYIYQVLLPEVVITYRAVIDKQFSYVRYFHTRFTSRR